MTLTIDDIQQLGGSGTVSTDRGEEVGAVGQFYLDDDDHRTLTWVTVAPGGAAGGASFVPLLGARVEGSSIVVPYAWATIEASPRVAQDGAVSPHEEEQLYRHYGIPVARDQPEPTARLDEVHADADADAMVLSEERLRIGTEVRESGRARLRKHVTTEQVSQTVPLRHEEIRIERVPVTDAERRAGGAAQLGEEEHVVVLHEERAVVDKEVVATERVRLAAVTVTEQQTVSAEVRKEEVEVEQTHRP